MDSWSLDDIPWEEFDATRVDPEIVPVIKAASLVERNARDYRTYLHNIFSDDPRFLRAAEGWAEEEVKHGQALGKWAEMADPSFDFCAAFRRFRAAYQLPLQAQQSIRGSRAGELVARSMVEIGTTSYYTFLADATDEPVLKAICRHIAADEYAHFCLFQRHLDRYLVEEPLRFTERLKVALSRIGEAEDDELARAYHAANRHEEPYDRGRNSHAYEVQALEYCGLTHVSRGTGLFFRAIGLNPGPLVLRLASWVAWLWLAGRRQWLCRFRPSPFPAR